MIICCDTSSLVVTPLATCSLQFCSGFAYPLLLQMGEGITFFSWQHGWVTTFFSHVLLDNLVGLCLNYLEGKEQSGVSSKGCSSSKFSREG